MRWKLPRLKPESDAFLHLDALRFIAAMGIVFHHFREDWAPNAFLMQRFDGMNLFVDLFFAISGIIISHVYGRVGTVAEFWAFVRKRIARLAPLHWLTLLFFVAVGLAAERGLAPKSDHYDWGCLPWNVLMLHSAGVCHSLTFNYVSWSISAEMIVYVAIFPLALALGRRARWLPPLVGVAVLVGLYLAPAPRPWWEWTFDSGAARAAAGFLIGTGIFAYRRVLARIVPDGAIAAPAVLALFLGGMAAGLSKGVLVLVAYIVVIAAVAADEQGKVGPVARWLAPLGSLTFGIYMLHPVIRTALISVIGQKVLKADDLLLDAIILLAAAVVVVAAYASKFWFEDPARRWLSGVRLRRMSPEEAVAP